jgi:polyhydroxyalkanoate synthase
MADKLVQPGWDPLVLAAQLQRIATDFFKLMTKMMTNPAAVASAQIDLFYGSLNVWQKTAEHMLMPRAQEANAPQDKRFKHPEWSENAIFGFVKDSNLVAAKSILTATRLDSDRVPAREPGGGKLTIIERAPGSYVRVRSAA